MRRAIRTVLIAVFTILTFAAIVVWILAYTHVPDGFSRSDGFRGLFCTVFEGRSVTWALAATDLHGELTLLRMERVNDTLAVTERFHGFGKFQFHEWAWKDPSAGRFLSTSYTVPLWFPPLVFGAYPFISLLRGPFLHWRRRRRGLCVKCGYNLAGNTTGTCPECGTKCESKPAMP